MRRVFAVVFVLALLLSGAIPAPDTTGNSEGQVDTQLAEEPVVLVDDLFKALVTALAAVLWIGRRGLRLRLETDNQVCDAVNEEQRHPMDSGLSAEMHLTYRDQTRELDFRCRGSNELREPNDDSSRTAVGDQSRRP